MAPGLNFICKNAVFSENRRGATSLRTTNLCRTKAKDRDPSIELSFMAPDRTASNCIHSRNEHTKEQFRVRNDVL
jgi:hypothetical protein